MYGSALHSTVYDATAYSTNVYNYGYECGVQTVVGMNSAHYSDSRESTPDTVTSDHRYVPDLHLQSNFNNMSYYPNAPNNGYVMQQNKVENDLIYDLLGNDFDDIYMNMNDAELKALLASNDIKKTVCLSKLFI